MNLSCDERIENPDTLTGSGYDADTKTLTLDFTIAKEIPAGQPFLIKWASGSDIVDPVFTGVTINNTPYTRTTSHVNFIGLFSPEIIYEDSETIHENSGGENKVTGKTKLYLGAENTLYYPTEKNFQVNSFRAYFELLGGLVAGEPAANGTNPAVSFNMNLGSDATGISEVSAGLSPQTTVVYDLQGRRVSNPTKGIYIVNGRKVAIK